MSAGNVKLESIQRISLEQAKEFYEMNHPNVSNRGSGGEGCIDCEEAPKLIEPNWDAARFDSIFNVWVVPIHGKHGLKELTLFNVLDVETFVPESQNQKNELIISKNDSGEFSFHIFKICGTESFRGLSKMGLCSWNNLDISFEGLVGYWDMNDSLIHLYRISNNITYKASIIDISGNVDGVEDRDYCEGGGGYWQLRYSIPCSTSERHTCESSSCCCPYCSYVSCVPPECGWEYICPNGDIIYGSNPNNGGYTSFPISTGGGVKKPGWIYTGTTSGTNTGPGITTTTNPDPHPLNTLPNNSSPATVLSEFKSKFNSEFGINLSTSENSDLANTCFQEVWEPGNFDQLYQQWDDCVKLVLIDQFLAQNTAITLTQQERDWLKGKFGEFLVMQTVLTPADINFIIDNPWALDNIMQILNTNIPDQTGNNFPPNPMSANSPTCAAFFNFITDTGPASGITSSKMVLQNAGFTLVPLNGNTQPYQLYLPSFSLEFTYANPQNQCIPNLANFSATALNNSISILNASIAAGYPFNLPRFSPTSNPATIRNAIAGRLQTIYLSQLFNFTQGCGVTGPLQNVTPSVMLQEYPGIAPTNFSARRTLIGC